MEVNAGVTEGVYLTCTCTLASMGWNYITALLASLRTLPTFEGTCRYLELNPHLAPWLTKYSPHTRWQKMPHDYGGASF